MKMVWKWFENGMKMVWKWYENGMKMVWKWYENGLKMVWKWFENGMKINIFKIVQPHLVTLVINSYHYNQINAKKSSVCKTSR